MRNQVPLFFIILIFATSCLKNEDGTANGPKAEMVISNYAVNNAAFDVAFDNSSLTTTPLSFGAGTGSGTNLYTKLAAGTHSIRLSAGNNVAIDNIFSLTADRKYSFFVYDTLKTASIKSLLLKDEIIPVDTIAKGRFLQFIPRSDTLTIKLTKNANPAVGDTLAASDLYMGRKSLTSSSINFFLLLKPGDYKLELLKNDSLIFRQSSFSAIAGKVYSFIAKGVKNGTGVYEQNITVLQHN